MNVDSSLTRVRSCLDGAIAVAVRGRPARILDKRTRGNVHTTPPEGAGLTLNSACQEGVGLRAKRFSSNP